MKPAAPYARVSTSQQEEQGTIASQVTVLKELLHKMAVIWILPTSSAMMALADRI